MIAFTMTIAAWVMLILAIHPSDIVSLALLIGASATYTIGENVGQRERKKR